VDKKNNDKKIQIVSTLSLSLSLLSFKIKQKTRFIQESSKKPVPPLSLTGKSLYFRRKKSPFFSWTSSRWIPSHFSPEKGLHFRQALSLTFRRKKPLFSSEKVSILAGKSLYFPAGLPLAGLPLTFRRKKVSIFAGLSLSLSAGKSLNFRRKISPFSPEKLSLSLPGSISPRRKSSSRRSNVWAIDDNLQPLLSNDSNVKSFIDLLSHPSEEYLRYELGSSLKIKKKKKNAWLLFYK